MPRPQFTLKALLWLTAVAAVGTWSHRNPPFGAVFWSASAALGHHLVRGVRGGKWRRQQSTLADGEPPATYP